MAANSPVDTPDTIGAFQRAKDRIDLSGLVFGELDFVGTGPFSDIRQVPMVEGRVEINLTGSLDHDMAILVPGAGRLNESHVLIWPPRPGLPLSTAARQRL